jgi:hypothetical protein
MIDREKANPAVGSHVVSSKYIHDAYPVHLSLRHTSFARAPPTAAGTPREKETEKKEKEGGREKMMAKRIGGCVV